MTSDRCHSVSLLLASVLLILFSFMNARVVFSSRHSEMAALPKGVQKPQRYFEAAAGSRYISTVLTVRRLETRSCGRSGGCVQPLR